MTHIASTRTGFRNVRRLGPVLLLMVAGCYRAPFETAPVHGKVTIDGVPLAGGRVMFAPIAKGSDPVAGKAAVGPIGDDGEYSVSTYADGDGAVVGQHWVTVFEPGTNQFTPTGAIAFPKFGRFTVREKKTVVAGEKNRIDIHLSRRDLELAVPSQD